MLVFCARPKVNANVVSRDIHIKRLIVKDKQKCLECRPVFVINGKFSKLQPRDKQYRHATNCSQKGMF